ncbi:hypothetical protein Tco_0037537 [Tanacetum coccineum]
MMTGTEFDIEKFDRKNDFRLWQVRMKALLEQQGLATGGDTLKLEDVLATLNCRVHIVRGQSHREKAANSGVIYVSQSEEHLKRDYPRYNHNKSQGFIRNEDQVSDSGADGYDSPDVIMAMSVEELLDWIMDSEGSYHITYRRDYLVNFKEYNGNNILLGDGREFRV